MRRFPFHAPAAAAACLLLAAGAALATPPNPFDETVATLKSAYARSVAPGEQAETYRELFDPVLGRLTRSYAKEVDLSAFVSAAVKVLEAVPPGTGEPAEVFRNAVNAALRTLDPHSRYIDPRGLAGERSEAAGFGGVGLEVESGEGAVRVVAAMPGTPAARAGLRAGDVIVQVDDQPLAGVALPDAIARMRGQPGTSLTMTVRRSGVQQEFKVALTRDTIRRLPLTWSMHEDVLVLRLTTFSGAVTKAMQEAVAEASATAAPRGVVLDMRGNGGGLLREGIGVADAFLGKGAIVSLRGRTPNNQRAWQADEPELLAGVPMVVLIDRRSASATELVADALQQHGRAVVMGQRSVGKGTVQTTFGLGEDKGAIKLTTSVYLGPGGATVDGAGVSPDIELARGAETAAAAGSQRARVDPARCGTLHAGVDEPVSCAVAYLRAGSTDAFMAGVMQASQ